MTRIAQLLAQHLGRFDQHFGLELRYPDEQRQFQGAQTVRSDAASVAAGLCSAACAWLHPAYPCE